MTKEEFYQSYLEDPILYDKKYLTPKEISNFKISDSTDVKILEVIKKAINGIRDRESETSIIRNINKIF